MEEQDRSTITARHPHHELAQDRHAKAPVIAHHHRSASPMSKLVVQPNWLLFEDDTELPGSELEVHDQLDR